MRKRGEGGYGLFIGHNIIMQVSLDNARYLL